MQGRYGDITKVDFTLTVPSQILDGFGMGVEHWGLQI